MKDLFFNESKHEYYYKGERVPCVSDILKPIDSIMLSGVPSRFLTAAAERGTKVHAATENLALGVWRDIEDFLSEEEDTDLLPYINAYMDFMRDYPGIPYCTEEEVYSEETGVAGKIDIVREINGVLSIIDEKTSASVGRLRSAIQLNIYRLDWNATHERKVERLFILQLKNNGKYRLIPIEVNEALAFRWIDIYREIVGDKPIK